MQEKTRNVKKCEERNSNFHPFEADKHEESMTQFVHYEAENKQEEKRKFPLWRTLEIPNL